VGECCVLFGDTCFGSRFVLASKKQGGKKMPNQNRRLWLIDAAYMFMSQQTIESGYVFDYKKLREKLEENGRFFQVYYVNSTPNPPTDQLDAFHMWLKSAPPRGPRFQVKLFPLKNLHVECPYCRLAYERRVQKGVDIAIATLALTLADRYDTLCLSSGDGDFRDMAEYVRNTLNKRFELVVFRSGVSTDLQSLTDEIYWLEDLKDEVRK
jgi:uncharacterized LabA/DUF88 family protein